MSDYIVNVCGDSSNATWLIKGKSNILYEAGMAYSAEKMIEKKLISKNDHFFWFFLIEKVNFKIEIIVHYQINQFLFIIFINLITYIRNI